MKIAAYTRVSSENQVENLSLATQWRLIQDHAQRQGWATPILYEDAGKSAFSDDLAARPAFARLIADAETGQFSHLLITDLDRLARNTSLALIVADRLSKAGCQIVSLNQGSDFRTPDGRLLYTLSSGFAEFASAQISRKTRAGLAHIRARGGHVGGMGYGAIRDADRRLVVDPARADALRLILTLAAQGSYDAVAVALNARAVPTPKRAPAWGTSSVRSVVLRGRWLLDQPDPWPALWTAAMGRPRVSRATAGSRVNELAGLLRCACGGAIVYNGDARRLAAGLHASVRCRRWRRGHDGPHGCPYRKANAAHYEALATAALLALPDLATMTLDPPDVAAARARLTARRLNLQRAVARGLPDDEADALQAAIDADDAALPLDSGTEPEMMALLRLTQWRWPTYSAAERNVVWRSLAARMVITGRELTVEWQPPLRRMLTAWDAAQPEHARKTAT